MSQLTGFVKTSHLCAPLADVEITRYNASGKVEESKKSDIHGRWTLSTFTHDDTIVFHHSGFVPKEYKSAPPSIVRLLDDQLIGYQRKLWFLPGEEIDAYIHSSKPFSAMLYRHGFYKEKMLSLGSFAASQQNVPDDYFVESGLDWHKSLTYQIPDSTKPGLYSLLLRSDGQEPFAMPMVVSNHSEDYGKKSKLLVLASTNTWQSYNLWGGRSRYRNFEDGSSHNFLKHRPSSAYVALRRRLAKTLPRPIRNLSRKFRRNKGDLGAEAAWRFKKLSIQRPFTNCRLEEEHVFQPFTNHLAGGEWRILAWLERENIPYDIVSGAELHWNPELLRHYKAVLLSTHCEYWTREMYEGLKHFHHSNGLWIINLSGNTMYREIKFFDDGSTCWAGYFQKSCADESKLLGVRLSVDSYGTCAPFKILRPNHWVFQNIPLNNKKTLFGGLSLNQNTPKNYHRYDPGRPGTESGFEGMGASGWETDELSKTAPDDIVVIAKGMHKRGNAHMVVREPTGNRGGLFSASSIVFGGSLLIDNVASMLTQNVITKSVSKGGD